jgi:oxalate---CoA ligase
MSFQTLSELLANQSRLIPNRLALADPYSPALTYAQLRFQVAELAKQLQSLGVHPTDRVAVVMRNGPEMALAFLVAACAGVCAPLNPSYTRSEFGFFLRDLRARALLVDEGTGSACVGVAEELGIPVVRLDLAVGALARDQHAFRAERDLPDCQPNDCALVLHTSGSTGKPKIVPLTQKNLCSSATKIVASLQLGMEDRCLNVMPLFHIHGLVGAVLASLAAGGSVICTPGFEEKRFFSWLETCHPTWFTAIPTIHYAIAALAEAHNRGAEPTELRFIRSCSSPLPPPLMARLEAAFGVPVVEAYGMTEAAHQISVNPLPPQRRKPGSVGLPAGVEVAIVDDDWNALPPETEGEIVVRGLNVANGYESVPDLNRQLFRGGWFRTGDQGHLDKEGYIFITGRIKDIINRGGEKIAPREIEEVLLEHPKVAQAVAFGIPHRTLGQDVAVAIVPRRGVSLGEDELRSYAFTKLADWKVPSRIVCVDEIAKGATGKLRRLDLHSRLREVLAPAYDAPKTRDERILAELWAKVLKQSKVGIHDNFFLCGGDSLAAVQLALEIGQVYGLNVSPSAIFRAPTVYGFAGAFLKKLKAAHGQSLVQLSWQSQDRKIFCVAGTMGNVVSDLGALAKHLGGAAQVYAFQDSAENPSGLKSLASKYVAETIGVDAEGPYFLLGICSGAVIALEMAHQLRKAGKIVAFLGMVEPTPVPSGILRGSVEILRLLLNRLAAHSWRHSKAVLSLRREGRWLYLGIRWRYYVIHWAVRHYRAKRYGGQIYLYLTEESLRGGTDGRLKWRVYAEQGAEVRRITGTHRSVTGKHGVAVEEAEMQCLASKLRDDLATVRCGGSQMSGCEKGDQRR